MLGVRGVSAVSTPSQASNPPLSSNFHVRMIRKNSSPLPADYFDSIDPKQPGVTVVAKGLNGGDLTLWVLLLDGGLRRAAFTLAISLATAKTHIARLFEKTGTQRQAELIRVAMSAFAPASA